MVNQVDTSQDDMMQDFAVIITSFIATIRPATYVGVSKVASSVISLPLSWTACWARTIPVWVS